MKGICSGYERADFQLIAQSNYSFDSFDSRSFKKLIDRQPFCIFHNLRNPTKEGSKGKIHEKSAVIRLLKLLI